MKLLMTLLAGSGVLLASCSRYPEVSPTEDIPFDRALNSTVTIENTLQSCYGALADTHLLGGNLFVWPTILSDAATQRFATDETPIYMRQFSASDPKITATWRWAYRVINRANLVIAKCEAETSLDAQFAANRNRFLGESYFLRALLHFELLRLYAPQYSPETASQPGIILRTQPVLDRDFPQLSSIDKCYAQVTQDFERAASLLPHQYGLFATASIGTGLPINGRATGGAAKAYLARVCFQKGIVAEYQCTIDRVTEAIGPVQHFESFDQIGPAPKVPQFYPLIKRESIGDLFAKNGFGLPSFEIGKVDSSEWIFWTQSTDIAGANRSLYIANKYSYYPSTFYTNPEYVPSDVIRGQPERGVGATLASPSIYIGRRDIWYEPGVPIGAPIVVNKYRNGSINIPIIRSAELLLTRAETHCLRNQPGDALNAFYDIIVLRTRAGAVNNGDFRPGTAPYVRSFKGLKAIATRAQTMPESMDTLLREIRTERLRELMFEGDRLHDLRRRRLPIPASGGRPEIDAASLKLPIPQAETNVNLAL